MKKTLHVRIVVEDFDLSHLDEFVTDLETMISSFEKKRIEVNLREPVEFRRKPTRE